jgi:alpha-tubulin suppressor-like RCC1 family protein
LFRLKLATVVAVVFALVFTTATPALAATAPSTPSAPAASIGDTSALITWTAPSDNGSPIDQYTVTSSPGGLTCVSASTQCLLQGLTNNVSYSFTVKAHNLLGYSSESAPSVAAFATHIPLKIATSTLSVPDSRFAFTHPTSGVQFVVTSRLNSPSKVIKFDDSGLRILETTNLSGAGVISAFMDRAGDYLYLSKTNSFSIIKFSLSSMSVVSETSIQANSTDEIGQSQLDSSGEFGLFEENGFQAQWNKVRLSDMVWVGKTAFNISGRFAVNDQVSEIYGLDINGGSYSCCTYDYSTKYFASSQTISSSHVVATMGTGFSGPSEAHYSRVHNRVFFVHNHGISRYVPGSTSPSINSWHYYVGSSSITLMSPDERYIYLAPTGGRTLQKLALPNLTLVGTTQLSSNSSFTAGAIAFSSDGLRLNVFSSGSSGEVASVAMADVSGPPLDLTIDARRVNEITVSWSAPNVKGHLSTGYSIEHSVDGISWTQVTRSDVFAPRQTISGLTTGTNYLVRVKSTAAVGVSEPAILVSAMSAVPPTIGTPTTSVTRTSLTANWIVTDTGGMWVTGYTAKLSYCDADQTPLQTIQTANLTATFNNLLPGIQYCVSIQGTNPAGTGAASSTVTSTTALAAPTNLVLSSRGVNAVSVSWAAPVAQPELIDDYKIEYSTDNVNWTVFARTASTVTSATITGLTQGTNYFVRVRAVDRTVFSTPITLVTAVTPAIEPTVAAPTLSFTRTSISASWSTSSNGGMSVSGYQVQLSADGSTWQSPVTQAGTSTTFNNLVPGATYHVRVRAQNAVGYGAYSTTVIATTALAAPTGLVVSARGVNQVDVNWVAAAAELGWDVTDYRVEYSADNSSWTVFNDGVSTNTSTTITGLTTGTTYWVRVKAISGLVIGSTSMISGVAPAVAPSIAAPAISRTRTSLIASWSIANTGGMAVSSYLVELSTNGSSWQSPIAVSGTTYTFTDLLPGTSYYVRVSGINAVGTGLPSVTTAVTTLNLGEPSNLRLVARGINAISISWVGPAPASQLSLVDDYKIEYSSDNVNWTVFNHAPSTDTSATITDLTKGVNYFVRVSAVDRTVSSVPAYLTGTAAAGVEPDATVPILTATRTSISVSWETPNDGGMAISNYQVQLSTDGSNWQSQVTLGGTSTTFSNLVPGVRYHVRIRAQNAVGSGAYSTRVIDTTPIAAPTSLSVTSRGVNQVGLSWMVNGIEPGWDITDFRIEYSTDNINWTVFDDGVSPYITTTLTGLNTGTAYWVRVRAISGVSVGTALTKSGVTSAVVPTISLPALSVTRSSVSASWSSPNTGGMAITAYEVQLSSDGSNWHTTASQSQTTTTFENLIPGSTYFVRVRAQNDVGFSAYSQIVSATTTPLDFPINLRQQARGNGSITLAWEPPDGNPELITDYVVEYSSDSGSTWTSVNDGVSTETTAVILGLNSGVSYAFRVKSKAGTASSVWIYPEMENATSVVAGTSSSCLLSIAKTVMCWGQNTYGQLGDGTTTSAISPKIVSALSNVVDIDLDSQHVCAVTRSGSVYCWGANSSGQAGVPGGASVTAPTLVPGINNAVSVRVGATHSCALISGGSVMCWGSNSSGQLGNGTSATSVTPVQVSNLLGALSFDAGGSTTCAVTSTRTVQCWGQANSGQIGNGSTFKSLIPAASSISSVSSVSVGSTHVCAVKISNEVWCWGSGASGKLGNSTTVNRNTPFKVPNLLANSVSAGASNTCAVIPTGSIKCWGLGTSGQIGNGTQTSHSLPISTGGGVISPSKLAIGAVHACVIGSLNKVFCWGSNSNSQLGTPPGSINTVPQNVIATYQVMGTPVIGALAVSDTGRTTANISWNILDDGGSEITNYEVQYSVNSGSTWSAAQNIPSGTGYSPTGLLPGQSYQLKIRAQNDGGYSEYETATFTTQRLDAARNLHLVTRTLNSVSVAWDSPLAELNLVTDYLVEYSANSGVSWTTFNDGASTATSTTITGLTNGVAYLIRVTAQAGSATSDSVVVTNPAQNTPIGMQISLPSSTTSSIRVNWAGVDSGPDPITRYVFETSIDGTNWIRNTEIQVSGSDTGSGFTNLTGLSSGKWYYVRAAAENIAGLGPWSNIERSFTSGYGRMTLDVNDLSGNPLKLGSFSWRAIDYSVASTGTNLGSARGAVAFERVYPKASWIIVNNAVAARDVLVSGWWVTAVGAGSQSLNLPVATPQVSNYTVRVVLPNGIPVPNATVEITGLSSVINTGDFTFTHQKSVTRGVTDPTGRVRVSGFVTGTVQATVIFEDPYLTQTKYGVAITGASQDIELDYMPFIQTPSARLQANSGALVTIPITYSDPSVVSASVATASLIDQFFGIASIDGDVSVTPPAGAPQNCGGAVLSAPIVNGTATLKVCASGSGEYVLSANGAVSLGAVSIEAAGAAPSIVPSLSLASNSDNSVTANWGAPEFDGGTAITGYRIDAVSGDRVMSWTLTDSATIQNRQATLTGLSSDLEWTVSVSALNTFGQGSSSSATIIIAGVVIASSSTELTTVTPSISGEARLEQVLSAVSGSWGPSPVSISYQWNRNGTAISGATGSTYTLTQTDFASSVSVTVTGAKNGFRTTSITSSVVGPVISLQVPTVVEDLSSANGRNRNFVRVLYKDFLNRDASEEEVNYWGNELTSGRVTQGSLPSTLSRSDTWIQAVIRGFYIDTLGREPDPAGYQYWITQARNGKPIADIGSFFYGSDEYFQTTGQSNYTVWIGDLYQKLMLRGGDPGGVAYWVGKLNSGMSRPAVSHWFYQSPEKLGLRVDSLYGKLLNRGSDPAGRAYWAGRLSGEGDLALASQLASSPEYYGRQFLR